MYEHEISISFFWNSMMVIHLCFVHQNHSLIPTFIKIVLCFTEPHNRMCSSSITTIQNPTMVKILEDFFSPMIIHQLNIPYTLITLESEICRNANLFNVTFSISRNFLTTASRHLRRVEWRWDLWRIKKDWKAIN